MDFQLFIKFQSIIRQFLQQLPSPLFVIIQLFVHFFPQLIDLKQSQFIIKFLAISHFIIHLFAHLHFYFAILFHLPLHCHHFLHPLEYFLIFSIHFFHKIPLQQSKLYLLMNYQLLKLETHYSHLLLILNLNLFLIWINMMEMMHLKVLIFNVLLNHSF